MTAETGSTSQPRQILGLGVKKWRRIQEVSLASAYQDPLDGVQVIFNAPGSGASALVNSAPLPITNGGTASRTAQANGLTGSYTLSGLAPGTYTLTPSRAGYRFTPPSTQVMVAGANLPNINFTARIDFPLYLPILVR